MNKFPIPFAEHLKERTVELVPLLDVELADGSTGYMSDRRFEVVTPAGTITYLPRILKFSGIQQDIKGSSSTASFTLSNIDRVMSRASKLHSFNRARVSFRLFAPTVYAAGASFTDSSSEFWAGYLDDINYTVLEFTIQCKDGFSSLSLALPKRRASHNCQNSFDDGIRCPYSGYGRQQRRDASGNVSIGDVVQITDRFGNPISAIVGPAGETFVAGGGGTPNGSADFGPDINVAGTLGTREGISIRPGYGSCPKNVPGCYSRGMIRFFGGIRYVTSWATGRTRQTFGAHFTGRDPYVSYSSVNESVFNQPIPMVYCAVMEHARNPLTGEFPASGFISTPTVFQFRYEDTYTAVEAIVSDGRIGKAADGASNPAGCKSKPPTVSTAREGEDVEGIQEVYVNGLSPHEGQRPCVPGVGVFRSTGRIGEPAALPVYADEGRTKITSYTSWDQIGGDMRQADNWINPVTGESEKPPVIYLSGLAGFFVRVYDKNSGINNPQVANSGGNSNSSDTGKYSGSMPDVRAKVDDGRFVWKYNGPDSRGYGSTSNPVYVFTDLYFEALGKKYTTHQEHGLVIDIQAAVNFASYTMDTVPNIVNSQYETRRYLFSGIVNDLKPAIDHLDAVLRDCYGFRYWRGRRMVIKPYCAGVFTSENFARPAFQEFVNIIDGSFTVSTPKPEYNSLNMSFADIDFDFGKNSATVYSEDHQMYFSGDASRLELNRSESLMGTPTTDQAVRRGKRVLSDHLGGTTRAHWAKHRNYSLRSTVMMGELEVGDITYIAHTEVPDGGQWVRIQSRVLNEDLSIQWKAQSFEISNYDDTVIGVSTVDLAKFGYNPFIPGSGGIAFLPLPALLWADEVTPRVDDAVKAVSNLGIRLQWLPYNANPQFTASDAQTYNRLTLAVQIYRTEAARLREALPADETTVKVLYTMHLPAHEHLPFNMRIDDLSDPTRQTFEVVKVTHIDHALRELTVTRGEQGTPIAHAKGEFLYKSLAKGGFVARSVSKTATVWLVDHTSADFEVGEKYFVNSEIIKVISIDVTTENDVPITRITVERSKLLDDNDAAGVAAPAQKHPKLAQIMHVSFLDATPDFRTKQFGTLNVYDYVDPFLDGPAVPTITTTSTTSTTTSTTTEDGYTTTSTSSETTTTSTTSTTTTTTTLPPAEVFYLTAPALAGDSVLYLNGFFSPSTPFLVTIGGESVYRYVTGGLQSSVVSLASPLPRDYPIGTSVVYQP